MFSSSPHRPVNTLGRFRSLAALAFACVLSVAAYASINVALQMQTGNPSGATTDSSNHTHYLIQRDQYAMDYNDTTHEPNWVAWDLTSGDIGSSGRSSFIVDTNLPGGFYQVLTTDYSGSGYDRGHMCPSADRTVTVADNQQVFYMSNMVPQTPDNNQGVWASFETYCRTLANAGNEILIIAGPSGFSGTSIASGVAIPGYTWKIAIVVPLGSGTAASRITTSTRVITIKIPNIAGVRSTPWQNFVTSIAQIEADTGYTFLTDPAIPAATRAALRTVVDGQSSTGAPVIVAQPVSQTTAVGGNATFSVTVTGNAPLSYQWLLDDVEIPDATDSTLTLINVQAANAGSYTVVVSNSLGSATSNAAVLSLTGLPPSITTQPVATTAAAGSNAVIAVTAGGSPPLSYVWRKNGTPLANTGNVSGATTSALVLSNVQASDMANYDVVVTNSTSSVTSSSAALTVTPAAPTVTGQPQSQTLPVGSLAVFSVTAVGTAPLSYQWRKAGVALAGETSASLSLVNIQNATAGSYDVVVTNGINPAATSAPATLSIGAIPPDIAVERIGDGTAALGSAAAPVAVQIFARAGGAVLQTIGFPSAAPQPTVAPFNLTEGGSGTTSGYLNLASDGSSLVVPGYNAVTGTGNITSTTTAVAGRSIGVVNPLGVPTTTLAVNMFSGQAYRSLTSNGVNYWASGANGINYITAAGVVTSLNGSNVRNIEIYNSTLYVSSGSATPGVGISRVGTAGTLPTTATTPVLVIPTASGTGTPSPMGFAISPDGGWAYVADDRSVANGGGIQKWKLVSSTWTLQYTLATGLGSTARGLAVDFTNFNSSTGFGAVITATTTEGTNNKLIYYSSDLGSSTLPVVLASAGANFVFRGVDFAPATPVPTLTATSPLAGATLVAPTLPVTVTFNEAVNVVGTWFTMTSAANGAINPSVTSTDQKTFTLTPPVRFADSDTITVTLFSSQIAARNASSLHLGSNYTFSFTTAAAVAPQITSQPVAQTVAAGSGVTFSVVATGTAPVSYQWRKNGVNLTSNPFANSPTLVISNAQAADAGSYDVVVTNGINPSAVSTAAALTVNPAAPAITTAPLAQTVSVGDNVTLTVAATGTAPFSYQWRHNGVNITGNASATTATLTLNGVQPSDGGTYDVVITNGVGSPATSAAVQVTVSRLEFSVITWNFTTADPSSGVPADVTGGTITQGNNNGTTPLLTTTSASIGSNGTYTGASGDNNAGAAANVGAFNTNTSAYFTFTLSAPGKQLQATALSFGSRSTSTGPQAYALYSSVDGFTAPLAAGALANDSGWHLVSPAFTSATSATNTPVTFRLYGYNGTGSPGSNTANWRIDDLKLTVTTMAPVVITTQPVAQTATVGTSASFSVAATGTPVPFYQWRKDGVAIPGATAASFTIGSVLMADAGSYDVVLSNNSGPDVTSTAVALTVNPATPTIAWTPSSPIVYGTPLGAAQLNAMASVPGSFSYTPDVGTILNAGPSTLSVTFTPSDTTNYTGATTTRSLTVNPKPVVITLGGLAQGYDGTVKSATFTVDVAAAAAFVQLSYSPAVPLNAGSYGVTASLTSSNYSGGATDTLVITKATPTLAWSTPAAITYGTALSASQLNPTANVGGSFAYTPTAGTVLNAGANQTLTANFTPADPVNFNPASVTTTLTVNKATPTIAWAPTSPIVYGTALGTAQLNATTSVPGSFAYSPDTGAILDAGTSTLGVTFTPTDTANYNGATATRSLTVTPKAVVITLGNLAQTYDGSAKSATFTTDVAAAAPFVQLSYSPVSPLNAGSYAVTATLTSANYSGSASGNLIIVKATPVLAWSTPAAITYGTALGTSQLNATANVGGTFTYTPAAGTVLNAGVGQALSATFAPADAANYNGGGVSTTITVNKAVATVTLANLTQPYDGTPKSATVTTTPAGLTVDVSYNGSPAAPTLPGSYAVIATVNDANYTGSATGTLLIGITAIVRHAPTLSGDLDGSMQVLLPESITLSGNAMVSGDLLVPGLPTVQLTGHPTYGGTQDGLGVATPSNYTVTLSGNAVLRHVVRRTDAITLPVVNAPPASTQNVTTSGNAGATVLAPGNYGNLTASGSASLVLGVAGAITPAVYSAQSLTITGNATLQIVGPVVLTLANGTTLSGTIGDASHPAWLTVAVANGDVTLSGGATFCGAIVAPNGTVTISGGAMLRGTVSSDRLTISGNGLLDAP